MPTMRSWLLLCAALPAEPHAFWLTRGEEKTFVRFSESPAFKRTRHTKPSPPHIDPVTGGTYHKIMHVATTTTNAYNRKRCYGAAVEEA